MGDPCCTAERGHLHLHRERTGEMAHLSSFRALVSISVSEALVDARNPSSLSVRLPGDFRPFVRGALPA